VRGVVIGNCDQSESFFLGPLDDIQRCHTHVTAWGEKRVDVQIGFDTDHDQG